MWSSAYNLQLLQDRIDLGMVPGYLIIVYSQLDGASVAHLSIFETSSFSPLWSTDYGLSLIGQRGDTTISPICFQTINLPNLPPQSIRDATLSIHPHPFSPTRYTAWVVISSLKSFRGSRPYYSTIERYAIDLGTPYGISICRRSSVLLNDGRIGDSEVWGVSSSGHALWRDNDYEEHILSLAELSNDAVPRVEYSHGLDAQVFNLVERTVYRIAPQSGAITSLSRGGDILHVEYYE